MQEMNNVNTVAAQYHVDQAEATRMIYTGEVQPTIFKRILQSPKLPFVLVITASILGILGTVIFMHRATKKGS